MNKKLLAAAIAAAVALPMAAQAGVQVYGVIHASIDYVDPDGFDLDLDEFDDDSSNFFDVTSNTSRIGFKGSEDLGNGLKAIWKVEQGVDIADGGGSWATRNAYIGLAGDWGTFLYGRHDTPLKISTGKLDIFADRTADYNSTVGFIDRRPNDVTAYISPNMNGLTAAAACVAGYDAGFGADDLCDGYSLAVMYSNNGLFASVAYEDISDWLGDGALVIGGTIDGTPVGLFTDGNEIWRVGLGYEMNAFSIGFVYENDDTDFFATEGGVVVDRFSESADKFYIPVTWTFGNNVVKGMYGWLDPDEGSNRDSWAIGWDHNLSNRTTAYLLYTDSELAVHNYVRDTGLDGGSAFGLGMIHKF